MPTQAIVKLTRALEEEAATGQRPTHREPYRVWGAISLGVRAWKCGSDCPWHGMHTQNRCTREHTQVPLGPRVDTIDTLRDEVAHCNRTLELIRQEVETSETLEGDVQAAVVTLDLVRVATAFKKLPFQVVRPPWIRLLPP